MLPQHLLGLLRTSSGRLPSLVSFIARRRSGLYRAYVLIFCVDTSFCAPRSAASHIYLPLISHNRRLQSRTVHNGRDSVLKTCINCLQTASSAQDVLTKPRNSPHVTTTTPPRHTDVPGSLPHDSFHSGLPSL